MPRRASVDEQTARDVIRTMAVARRVLPRNRWPVDANALQVLMVLALDEQAGAKAIAAELATSAPTVSQAIARLREADLIAEDEPRRAGRTTTLTPAGVRLLKDVLRHARQALDES